MQMKAFLIVIITLAVACVGALAGYHGVRAQTAPMTEAHIERIRANCQTARSALSRVHASDGVLRVNLGPLYESISTKLMAPFNSRMALNKYDGAQLVEQTALYERQLNDFRADYKVYEESMSRTLRINCQNEPVAFYDSVAETREKRRIVNQRTLQLQKIIQEYKTTFEVFARTIEEKN